MSRGLGDVYKRQISASVGEVEDRLNQLVEWVDGKQIHISEKKEVGKD